MKINRVALALQLLWFGFTHGASAQLTESDRPTFARIKANAQQGNAEAQLQLAECYANGVGVTRDVEKAAKWHRKAADQGLARAQYRVGLDYANGEGVKSNQAEASRWFRRAANQGLADAQYELGVSWLSGRGAGENGAEAVEWLRKAAAQGHLDAEYQVGACYFRGAGVAKDVEEGIKWIRSAAEKGDALAQNELGTCFEKGEGVPKDYLQAYKWFALAAAQDDARAFDIRVSLAKVEAYLTKEQIAEAQRLAHEFKPNSKADRVGSASPENRSPQPSSNDNRAEPAQSMGDAAASLERAKSGNLTIKGNDEHCEVFVDGEFVGNSPAKLKLAEGKHLVEVKKSGFKDYRRELKVVAGSDLTLTAELEKP